MQLETTKPHSPSGAEMQPAFSTRLNSMRSYILRSSKEKQVEAGTGLPAFWSFSWLPWNPSFPRLEKPASVLACGQPRTIGEGAK